MKLQLSHWEELEQYLYDKRSPKNIMNIYYAIRDDAIKGRQSMRNVLSQTKKKSKSFGRFVRDIETFEDQENY